MKRIECKACEKSSNIAGIGYAPETSTLAVQFKGGKVYHYSGVPAELHEEFGKADSLGRFFQEKVRDKFETKPFVEDKPQ